MTVQKLPEKPKTFTSLEEWKKEYFPKTFAKDKLEELANNPDELVDFLVNELQEKVRLKSSYKSK